MKNLFKALVAMCAMSMASAAYSVPLRAEFGGNVYELYESIGLNLQEKLDYSENQSWNGVSGHLLTITSAAENQFIFDTFGPRMRELGSTEGGGSSITIALSDRAVEGTFVWLAGPEVGQAPVYTNWVPGEPNNFQGNEDTVRMDMGLGGSSYCCGRWNDSNAPWRFIIEFEDTTLAPIPTPAPGPTATAPEPATTALLALGLFGVGAAARRRKVN